MLSNAYFLAKFRFDTAENEPAKNLQNFAKFSNFADPNALPLTLEKVPTGSAKQDDRRVQRLRPDHHDASGLISGLYRRNLVGVKGMNDSFSELNQSLPANVFVSK